MADASVLIEATLRGGAAGGFIACAVVLGPWRPPATRLLCAAAYVTYAAHALAQFPPLMSLLGPWYLVFDFPSIVGAALNWLFCVEFFDDTSRFRPVKLLPAVTVLAIAIVARVSSKEIARDLWLANNFINVGLMAHVLVVVFRSWRNDLVESRRLAVAPLFLIGAAYTFTLAFVQSVQSFTFAPRQPSIIAAIYLLLSAWISLAIYGSVRTGLFAKAPHKGGRHKAQSPNPAGQSSLPPVDAAVIARLDELMRTEKLYRMENLKISALALRLRLPEYKLRRLLNRDLGYRNFSAYVSEWRLAEAKDALRDPSQVEVPISTIAIDSGFQSLAPFNRAFKAATGMTPTEYRAKGAEPSAPSLPTARAG